ncbi:hypothetical protein GCM10007423_54800 [Dyadobacter endophyticus]|uniref:Peptidase M12B domain-containing protein n=1 Tax=Dyadobacter endophyticus TaxID=1749036 RepID=A0ABQ1Z6D7_9BACT|nr:M12 family metallo-peptidase [Dyadobacter endophyticus]GGH51407.1 hypothetical protein GCM10007423_54800 [Dyadobacter endophyticus]
MRLFYLTILTFLAFSSAIAQQKPVRCGTSDDAIPQDVLRNMARLPAIMRQQKARVGAGEMNICRIHIEVDYKTFVKFEQDTNVIFRKVLEDIEKVSEVYEKEINTRMLVTNIRIFKNPDTDPFAASENIFSLLDILTNLPPAAPNFDKRAYFYTKPVTGNASGVAYIGGVTSVSMLGMPQLMMHEFGHNFASPHTHSCYWPGGPIDFCSSPEGGCYDKAIEVLTDRSGTLMSYCIWEPTFHPLSQAIMRNHADNAFSKITSAPEAPKLSANKVVSRGDFLIWPVITNALSYEVSYADNPDFTGSKTVSVPFNGFHVKDFAQGATIYLKIKSLNTLGSSAWSEPVQMTIGAGQLPPPDVAAPEASPIAQQGRPFLLPYSEVSGATGYEIQTAGINDVSFDYPYFSATSSSSAFYYTPDYPMTVRWRVRAFNDQDKGKWSDAGFFSVNPTPGYQLYVPVSENMPTSFPFCYFPMIPYSKLNITIADNQSFTHPIVKKEYSNFGTVSDVVSNLPANSQLYFRLEEWNLSSPNFPLKKIIDYTFPFKTGSQSLPGNLTFLSSLDPGVFDQSYPRIAATAENLWLTSQSNGYIRLNNEDLSYKVFNRKNTDGLIGFTSAAVTMQTDDSLKLHIIGQESNSNFRRVELVDDTPDSNASVNRFYSSDYFLDFSPSHKIYWNSNTIYKEENRTLVPFKTVDYGWNFRKVVITAGKMWILVYSNTGLGEIILADPSSGAETARINSFTHPELLANMEQFVLGKDGKLMIMQYDPSFNGYRLAFWDKQKWSILRPWDVPFSGGTIQAIASDRAGNFYVLSDGEQTRVFKYDGSVWKKVGSDIPFRNIATNIVPGENDHIWLTGQYGVARLTATQLDLVETDKAEYCVNDSVTVTMNVGGKVNATKPFTVVLKKANGDTESVPNVFASSNKISFIIPDGVTGPEVEIHVKSAEPEVNSSNALRVVIHGLPLFTMSVTQSVLRPLVDTATVNIQLTGEKPWAFTIWNGDSVSTELSNYSRPYVLHNYLGENLTISGLRDKHCYSRNVGNSIQIQANLITGVAEPSWPGVKVYPNPSAGKILLEFENQNNKPFEYHIADSKGVIVDSMQISGKLTEWDISRLSAGTYILWTVQNGSKRSWKIIKNK